MTQSQQLFTEEQWSAGKALALKFSALIAEEPKPVETAVLWLAACAILGAVLPLSSNPAAALAQSVKIVAHFGDVGCETITSTEEDEHDDARKSTH